MCKCYVSLSYPRFLSRFALKTSQFGLEFARKNTTCINTTHAEKALFLVVEDVALSRRRRRRKH